MKWYRRRNICLEEGCKFKRINEYYERCINCGIRRKYESISDNTSVEPRAIVKKSSKKHTEKK